jgi:tetratricopeptide (TPR) repeat protein
LRHLRLMILLALFAGPIAADEFNAAEFYGESWKASGAGRGVLSLALREGPLPAFIDAGSSGSAPASARMTHSASGMVLSPQSRATVALTLDLGALEATAGISVIELDQGGTLAWRVSGMNGDDSELLAELTRSELGFALRMRARGATRYIQVPGAQDGPSEIALPASFRIEVGAGSVRAEFAGLSVTAPASFSRGVTLSVAVSDQRARVADLKAEAELAPHWIQLTAARLKARRALSRLREHAAAGLLAGVAGQHHPRANALIAGYSDEQRELRKAALKAPPAEAARALAGIAELQPENPLAQHEAGIAALLAGMTAAGERLLEKASELDPAALTLLALAEARRRAGNGAGAENALQMARAQQPEAPAPETALIEARLRVDQGRLAEAAALLSRARGRHPEHAQLAAFADSARLLTSPEAATVTEIGGPFGLAIMSDMHESELSAIVARIAPYARAMRDWLPGLGDELPGRIVIYSGPVEYLAASLLVAGEQLDNVAGMFVRNGHDGEPMILACRAFGEDELTRTLVHELWHLCLHSVPWGAAVPRWLDEGMAVYLSAGRVAGTRLVFDSLPAEFPQAPEFWQTALDAGQLAQVLEAGASEFYDAATLRLNYAASWALVWYYARETVRRTELTAALRGTAEFSLGEDPSAVAERVSAAVQRLR